MENQNLFWLPTNSETKTLTYNARILKSEPDRYPPLAWKISKVDDTAVRGITKFTMTQEMFDPVRDNAELMIANYYQSAVIPEVPEMEEVPIVSNLEIIHSGQPSVRAGGGYKKFTLKSIVGNEKVDISEDIVWSVDALQDKLQLLSSGNVVKIKCVNDYSLIGKTFNLIAESSMGSKVIIVEVTGL